MARKRKELPVLEDVEILDVAAEGNALARVDEMVVFVPFGAPGDRVDIKIEKKKKSYAQGRIEKMRKETAGYGYDKCLKWSQDEAARRKSLEDALSN